MQAEQQSGIIKMSHQVSNTVAYAVMYYATDVAAIMYSAYRPVRICNAKNIGTGFFVGQTLTLIDNRPIFDRMHHINLRLKNIRPDPQI